MGNSRILCNTINATQHRTQPNVQGCCCTVDDAVERSVEGTDTVETCSWREERPSAGKDAVGMWMREADGDRYSSSR